MSAPKVGSRYIPTLTEVVSAAQPAATDETGAIAERVVNAMLPRIEAHLRASLQAIVDKHVAEALAKARVPMRDAILAALRNQHRG